jgi:RimJ/RimL family protein N-acetyltransferase
MRPAQPTDPIQTDRLVLTPVGTGDVDELILLHGDPMVARWNGPWSAATTAEWTKNMAGRWTTDGVGKWLADDRSDSSLVGPGGFTLIDLDGEAVLELAPPSATP